VLIYFRNQYVFVIVSFPTSSYYLMGKHVIPLIENMGDLSQGCPWRAQDSESTSTASQYSLPHFIESGTLPAVISTGGKK